MEYCYYYLYNPYIYVPVIPLVPYTPTPRNTSTMLHDPVAKRRRQLLKVLKARQKLDEDITPAELIGVKYNLPYHRRCTRVRVKHAHDDEASVRLEVPRSAVPRFIMSQLEFWGLTDNEFSDTLRVPRAVEIFLSWLPTGVSTEATYPTIFTWPCPVRHRNLYFFAYVNLKMASKKYTISELLALRSTGQTSQDLLTRAIQNPDLALIVNQINRENAHQVNRENTHFRQSTRPYANTRAGRRFSMRYRDDSSTTSEEVLFKGTASRRDTLARETILSRQVQPKAEEKIELKVGLKADPVDETKGEMVWKYRGRSDSDASINEPIPAPAGVEAQKSEGFQRFYKAVVSPTHVRVTAGGRIVPNTRGTPSSPTMNRAQSGSVAGSSTANGQTATFNPAGLQPGAAPGAGQQNHPLMPQFFPGFGPGFQPFPPHMPFYPMPFAPQMAPPFPYPPHGFPMHMAPQASAEGALKDTHNLKTGDGQGDNAGNEPQSAVKVKTAPPSQFDATKPFVYNGQWMYPMPGPLQAQVGGPYMPMPMPMPMPMGMPMGMPMHGPMMGGPRPPMAPPMPVPMMQPSANVSGPSTAGSTATVVPARSATTPQTVVSIVPSTGSSLPPSVPHPSSIKMSQITKAQLVSLRKQLKYHEDQLQYNRHQIDENDMEQRIRDLQAQIERFERQMQRQLEEEKGQHVGSEKSKEMEGSSESSTAQVFENTAAAVQQHPATANKPLQQQLTAPPVSYVLSKKPRTSSAMVPYKFSDLDDHEVDKPVVRSGMAQFKFTDHENQEARDAWRRTELPSGAALAPPFEPRLDSQVAPVSMNTMNATWTAASSPNAMEESYRRLSSYNHASQPLFGYPIARQVDVHVASVPSKGSLAVPYLIGILPKGLNPRYARDSDYQYSRELTEDELRARHLYWGEAPRSAQRGLPKYDGKNFYPPSPVKDADKETVMVDNPATLGPIGSKANVQLVRPSTPIGTAVTASDSFESQEPTSSDELNKVIESALTSANSGSVKGKTETEGDSASVGSHDRRSEKPGGARLWETMLKKGSTSSAVSSTTAQGQLPQYTGFAAASLSPTINRNSDRASLSPARDFFTGKEGNEPSEGGALLTPMPERRGKNRALNSDSAADHLSHNNNVAASDVSIRSGSIHVSLGP